MAKNDNNRPYGAIDDFDDDDDGKAGTSIPTQVKKGRYIPDPEKLEDEDEKAGFEPLSESSYVNVDLDLSGVSGEHAAVVDEGLSGVNREMARELATQEELKRGLARTLSAEMPAVHPSSMADIPKEVDPHIPTLIADEKENETPIPAMLAEAKKSPEQIAYETARTRAYASTVPPFGKAGATSMADRIPSFAEVNAALRSIFTIEEWNTAEYRLARGYLQAIARSEDAQHNTLQRYNYYPISRYERASGPNVGLKALRYSSINAPARRGTATLRVRAIFGLLEKLSGEASTPLINTLIRKALEELSEISTRVMPLKNSSELSGIQEIIANNFDSFSDYMPYVLKKASLIELILGTFLEKNMAEEAQSVFDMLDPQFAEAIRERLMYKYANAGKTLSENRPDIAELGKTLFSQDFSFVEKKNAFGKRFKMAGEKDGDARIKAFDALLAEVGTLYEMISVEDVHADTVGYSTFASRHFPETGGKKELELLDFVYRTAETIKNKYFAKNYDLADSLLKEALYGPKNGLFNDEPEEIPLDNGFNPVPDPDRPAATLSNKGKVPAPELPETISRPAASGSDKSGNLKETIAKLKIVKRAQAARPVPEPAKPAQGSNGGGSNGGAPNVKVSLNTLRAALAARRADNLPEVDVVPIGAVVDGFSDTMPQIAAIPREAAQEARVAAATPTRRSDADRSKLEKYQDFVNASTLLEGDKLRLEDYGEYKEFDLGNVKYPGDEPDNETYKMLKRLLFESTSINKVNEKLEIFVFGEKNLSEKRDLEKQLGTMSEFLRYWMSQDDGAHVERLAPMLRSIISSKDYLANERKERNAKVAAAFKVIREQNTKNKKMEENRAKGHIPNISGLPKEKSFAERTLERARAYTSQKVGAAKEFASNSVDTVVAGTKRHIKKVAFATAAAGLIGTSGLTLKAIYDNQSGGEIEPAPVSWKAPDGYGKAEKASDTVAKNGRIVVDASVDKTAPTVEESSDMVFTVDEVKEEEVKKDEAKTAKVKEPDFKEYTVEAGDSFYLIADEEIEGLRPADGAIAIARANGVDHRHDLKKGDKILVPSLEKAKELIKEAKDKGKYMETYRSGYPEHKPEHGSIEHFDLENETQAHASQASESKPAPDLFARSMNSVQDVTSTVRGKLSKAVGGAKSFFGGLWGKKKSA